MNKKYIIIMIVAILPLLSNAQHLDFFGIQMNSSISNFEKILMDKGVERHYNKKNKYIYKDTNGNMAFYNVYCNNQKYWITVCSTPYSDNVYSVSISFFSNNQDSLKAIYYRVIGEIVAKYDLKKKMNKQIYSNDFGEVHAYVDNSSVVISFVDNENDRLREAEEWLDKKICKRLQKKYKNPLFYDKNPRFK